MYASILTAGPSERVRTLSAANVLEAPLNWEPLLSGTLSLGGAENLEAVCQRILERVTRRYVDSSSIPKTRSPS
jgi:hypothetical protein